MSVTNLQSTAALLENGQVAEARHQLEELVARVPTYVAAHVLLAKIAESDKRLTAALEHWQDAYELLPVSSVINNGLRAAALRVFSGSKGATSVDDSRTDDLDLDGLIMELEQARIVPDPDIKAISADELEDDIEDIVSETLARIYAKQKYYAEAQRTYESLAKQHPGRRHEFETKAVEMGKLASENE